MTMISGSDSTPAAGADTSPRDWGSGDPYAGISHPPVPPTPHRHDVEEESPRTLNGSHITRQEVLRQIAANSQPYDPAVVPPGTAFVATENGVRAATEEEISRSLQFDNRATAPDRRQEEQRSDPVNHPSHYGGRDDHYEAIKVIEAWGLGFCLGNTVKYIARAEKKGAPITDLKKARWYLDREIMRREQTTEEEH